MSDEGNNSAGATVAEVKLSWWNPLRFWRTNNMSDADKLSPSASGTEVKLSWWNPLRFWRINKMSDADKLSPSASGTEEEEIPSKSTRIDRIREQQEVASTSTKINGTREQQEVASTSTRIDGTNELRAILPVAATGDIIEIIQQTDCRVNVHLTVANAEIHGQNVQVGDQCTMPLPGTTGSDSSEKLKKLLGEATLQLKAYRKHEGAVFIEPPAFKSCQKKLEKGALTIVGASGDGKTTIAKELLLRQTKRRAVIISDEDDWKKVDLAQDEHLIILFDDMLGKFVPDRKKYWDRKLDKIFDAVRSGNIQVVITCRETVLSRCREEIEHFELFKRENRVHLSGPHSTCNLDTDTKRKMIQKHINLMSNISICDKLDDENLSGDERKISSKSLHQIALKNCPSFPQCCYTFVSMPACFKMGDTFFDNPTKCLIKEINRMRTSDDKIDQFNYCTLVCVLFYEKLTDDTIEKQLETIKVIAESCGIYADSATLHAKIRLAATRLSTSYLVETRYTGYTFQHNSLLQAIFTSFFKSHPKLLIEHCEYNLIQSLVTTEQATEKSDLFCEIQCGTQTDCLCSRLVKEIIASNVIRSVEHRALTDPVFVSKFFSHINTSSNKKTVLQSTEYNKSILCWAAGLSDKCFVKPLLTELESVMSVDTMEEEMSTALCEACSYGNYGVFTLLISQSGVKVTDDCLFLAANGGDDRIVTDLLSVKKWSTHDFTEALNRACRSGGYDVYRLLITHDATAIDHECLCGAASGGDDRIVTELLSVKKWSTHDVTQALYMACSCGRYDVYRLLITYDVTAIGDECLCGAASGGNDRIVTDLLSIKKWSTHDVTHALYVACCCGRYDVYRLLITYDVTADQYLCGAVSGGDDRIVTELLSVKNLSTRDITQALYEACMCGRYHMFRLLITYDVTAIDGECLCKAVSGGDDRIVTDLLSLRKWSTHDVTEALNRACRSGGYDVYKSLITHDVSAIDARCLCEAAIGGDDRIVTELLSIKKWSTRDITQALYKACSECKYNVYRSLITYDVTAIDDECLCKAASGGDDRIVTDLLSVKKWSTHDVTQALYKACSKSRYNMYRSLITYDVTAIDDTCLWKAAIGGHDRIVTDLLSVKKWSTHDVTQALYKACSKGRYDMYRSLITYDVTAICDTCLCEAASGGDDRIVTELLSVKKWSTHDVTQALYKACSKGRYDVYRLLITHDVTAIDGKCLCEATSGGDDRIVTDLLSVKKCSTHHVTQALYKACSEGKYNVYRSLITYDVTATDDECLCKAASGGDDRIVKDLLSVKKWSTHDVTQALYKACSKSKYDMCRSLITYDVTAVDNECLCKAASGGDDRIVTDLLSVKKWSTHDVTQALCTACSEGRYDVYRLLITHDVTAIDGQCLCEAASGGDDRIVTELLSVKKWSTHDVTQALCTACSEGRYDVYRLLITHDVTAIDGQCLCEAASGGDDRIVTELLSVKKWSTHEVTQALCMACGEGRYDVYRLLITHDVTAIDDKCMCDAASGGNKKIKDDFLSKGYKLPF